MSSGKADKALEEFLTAVFVGIGKLIKAFCVGLWRGIKKMRTTKTWIGLLLCVLIAALISQFGRDFIMNQESLPIYIKYIIYVGFLGLPVIYLLILGSFQDKKGKEFEAVFATIGFKGKDGRYPYLIDVKKDGKKIIYLFKSNIPLAEWKAAKARLETGFNCNILLMENTNNKQIVRIVTVPADCKIPDMLLWEDSLLPKKNGTITVGQSALETITFDLNRVPHVLVAGETGSGKSVILRTCLWQMINQGCKVYMIDFKGGVEFGIQYERYGEVITDRSRALEVLTQLCNENEYRLSIFRDLEVKNLAEYNKKTGQNLCRIGVFSDEIAEMLDKKGVAKQDKEIFDKIEGKLSTLARLSRATGINLFLGVQRPDANVLTGQIKNNIPVRISGRFADKAASEIVLGNTAATELPDIKGRFLYKVGNDTIEFQSYFFDDETMLKDVYVEVGDMLTQAPTAAMEAMEECKDQAPAAESAAGKGSRSSRKSGKEYKVSSRELERLKEQYDSIDLNMDFDQ